MARYGRARSLLPRHRRAARPARQLHVWPGGHGSAYWNDDLGFYAQALATCRWPPPNHPTDVIGRHPSQRALQVSPQPTVSPLIATTAHLGAWRTVPLVSAVGLTRERGKGTVASKSFPCHLDLAGRVMIVARTRTGRTVVHTRLSDARGEQPALSSVTSGASVLSDEGSIKREEQS